MLSLKSCAGLTIVMDFVSLAALLLSYLALSDIYHGEADARLEWTVLQVSAVIPVAFIAGTVFTLGRVLRSEK